jgi:EAL domain-containing protein (putative c-di-GMP-specific phosphodiesterase class I)
LFSQKIDRYQLSPDMFAVELTEGLIIKDMETATQQLESLRDLGGKICVDDFGTGYSSLSYLHRLPIDQLKIDRSFIWELGLSTSSHAITQAIITMGDTMGLEVIAEGVETVHQLQWLQQKNCHLIQGYLLSKPLEADEVPSVIAAQRILPNMPAQS